MAGLLAVGSVAVASTWSSTPAPAAVHLVQPADVSTPVASAAVVPTVAPTVAPTLAPPVASAPVAAPVVEPNPVRVAVPQADPVTEAPAPVDPTTEPPVVVPTVDPTAEPEPGPTLDTTPNATDVAPVWHQATCEVPDGSVDIPAVDGVTYDVDTIPGPEGNYLLGVGDHTVNADSGSENSGHSAQWSFTVVAPTGC